MRNKKREQFIRRLKFVKARDLLSIIPMLAALLFFPFFRLKHRNVWLICERKEDARDNGYWLYKYIVENHKEIEAVYAIDKKSPDYDKVASLGHIIQFGSFEHWIYYWLAKRNISSQKEGKPNAALCFILEVYFGLRKNRVFLQHGITQSDARWLYYDVTKLNLFICAVKDEYDYISKTFNYPKNTVQLCGFSRYDNLLSPYQIKRQILVMPTMRDWLRIQSSDTLKYEVSHDFYQSDYYKHWNSLINSNRLHKILCEYNIDVVFYLHAGMQKYVDYFASDNQRVIIGRPKEYDVQQLLKESCVLITDYSSVFFDFAYMEKPLIYFQFDYEKFRRGQYQQGFFSYENNGFGPVVQTEAALLDKLEMILKCNCEMPEKYRSRTIQFFTYRDTHNCGRIYNAIANMKI